jgi:TolA-binding protein
MDEFGEELEEIKREIVESRALTIKTNNLVNGLGADIRSISRRQQAYERSLRLSSIGFGVLVVALVLVGAKIVVDARVDSERARSEDQRESVTKLEKEIKLLQSREEARAQSERAAVKFHELLAGRKRAEAIAQWPEVSKLSLTRSERATFERTVERFRNELSVLDYHAALDHIRAKRWHEAEGALRSSLENKDDAAHADEATFQLARTLRTLGRQREAISLLLRLTESSKNREVLDDALMLLSDAQTDIEAWNDAKGTLRTFIRRFPDSAHRHQARANLAKLKLYH